MNDIPLVLTNDEQWLPVHEIQLGDMNLVYEAGRIRYITWKGHETIRMIFTALRDEQWNTIPYIISDEMIEEDDQHFQIQFKAVFETEDIHFEAFFLISGSTDGTLFYQMEGKALTDFSTKRTGICVHHPANSCAGEPVMIVSENGTLVHADFPKLISAHQPFTDIAGMRWRSKEGVDVELVFEGDLFETEDQRNWTDDSYKTYSGPQYRVPMIHLKKGDTIFHKVTARLSSDNSHSHEQSANMLSWKSAFPQIGYRFDPAAANIDQNMTGSDTEIPFDHLLFQIHTNSEKFEDEISQAVRTAGAYSVPARLQVFCQHFSSDETNLLVNALNAVSGQVASILLLPETKGTPPQDEFVKMYGAMKKNFPSIRIGYGSSGWFANLNLSLPKNMPCDFVGFIVNPQVHQEDHRSILENLHSLHTLLQTLREELGEMPVHTLFQFAKKPDNRWRTEFGAMWILYAVFNLSGAESITIADLQGRQGIFGSENPPALNAHLERIRRFAPVSVSVQKPSLSPNPMETLRKTEIVLENASGNHLRVTVGDI